MIKLRAWLPGENKFVYSDKECYTCDNELITWGFNEEGLIEVGYISNVDYKYVCLTNKVDRFTGVYSTNGNGVYERDITDYGYVVTYVDGTDGADLGMDIGFYEQRDNFESFVMLEAGKVYEVFGNTHEGVTK